MAVLMLVVAIIGRRRYLALRRILAALLAVALFTAGLGGQSTAQVIPSLTGIEGSVTSQEFIPIFTQGNIETSPVFLDGRIVGLVPGYINIRLDPSMDKVQRELSTSERSHAIHSRLQKYLAALEKYAKRRLDTNGVSELNAQKRDLNRLLDVFVEESADGPRVMVAFPKNDPPELLYTITPADVARVRLDSSEPTAIARRIAQKAKSALLQGWEELQPPIRLLALRRATFSLLVISGISVLGLFGQKRLRVHQTILLTRLHKSSDGRPDPSESGHGFRKVPFLKRVNLRHQISLISFYSSALYWGQWLLWTAGVGYIAGLFPQTRPFRNWLIGVSVRGYLGGNDPIPVGWPPLDWICSLGREATIGLPVLILLLALMTRVSIRAGNLLCDLYVKEWMQGQEGDRNELRAPTLARALKGWIAVGVYLILGMVVIYQLHRLGAVTQAVAVFLGFLSFALSLASQNLLKDLIGGFLILLEDQYAAGDVVIIGDQAGLVEKVGLRVTRLRNLDGELITIPNGVVSTVRNLSSNWSRVNYAIQVDVAEDADRVMDIMNVEAQALSNDPDWREKILEAPEILGIDDITHEGMLIRMLIRTRPLEQWSVGREYRRRLKKALDKAGIAVGVPQLEVQGLDSLG